MTPFILKGAVKIEPDDESSTEYFYDRDLQVWVNHRTGVPVILSNDDPSPTRYGETTMTETREGADQTEITQIHASRFGETSLTKTFEGADQGEGSGLTASRFGETSLTRTQEGVDEREVTNEWRADLDAPYSHF